MNLLELWVHTPGAIALGRTLAHSLWEGALVALLLLAALGLLRSARARYAAACLAMLGLLAAFCFTFQLTLAQQQHPAGSLTKPLVLPPAPSKTPSPDIRIPARFDAADYLPWLAPLWIAGVFFFHLRGIASWLSARRLRRTGVCAATSACQLLLDRLSVRVRLSRPVTLLESCLSEVPVVIGYLRPVILMPVGLLAGLPAAQVESILLHELAHIRRHDYLVNLLQIFVESLVFYHPAVWWISGVIRAERENCCDDLVVATQGDAFAYAAALTALEQNRGAVQEAVLAATGGSLVKRVRRLLVQPEGPRATLTPILSAAILSVSAAAVLTAWQSAPPPAPPRPSIPSAPVVPPAPTAPPLLAQVRKTSDPATPSPDPYHLWLTQDVAYIISDAERRAFKSLQSDPEREHFIEQFWTRRDPTPGTVENEFKQEHFRRIAYTNEHFAAGVAGWKTDRGRVYITYGPPDQKESHPSGGTYQRPAAEGGGTTVTVPFEQWLYKYIEGVGTNVIIEFIDPAMSGEYRMTTDPSSKDALLYLPPHQPPTDAASRKTGTAVQRMAPGATLISIPLTAYGDHKVTVSAKIFTTANGIVTTFEDTIQGPAPLYTKIVPLPAGTYRVEVIIKDASTNQLATDSLTFEAK